MDLSARKEVTAIIVNYGGRKDSADLLQKIAPQVSRTIIVDNSSEISPDAAEFKNALLITPPENIGFGAAVNMAARQADTRWLLILNPDVRLKGKCLQHLLNASIALNAPLCGPRFYWDNECTLQLPPALGHPLWLLSDRHNPNNNPVENPDLGTLAKKRHVQFWSMTAPFSEPVLSGACLLVDKQWFRQHKVPVFDEDFFLYYEDTDLCGRLMRKGVMPVCVPDARVVHYWNQSAEPPQGKAELMRASEEIFLRKYYPNGPPALPKSETQTVFKQLGILATPLALELPADSCHLDIGVQNDFIVFARAAVEQSSFSFRPSMWDRLRDGTYYLRAIDISGNSLQHWQFEKQTPEGVIS